MPASRATSATRWSQASPAEATATRRTSSAARMSSTTWPRTLGGNRLPRFEAQDTVEVGGSGLEPAT